MVEARTLWLAIPRPLRELPTDLVATLAIVLVTNGVVLTPVIRETPLVIPFGLAFVLFVPGYAVVAVLFPESARSPVDAGPDSNNRDRRTGGSREDGASTETDRQPPVPSGRGVNGIERFALSIALSIVLVALLGVVLAFSPWYIQRVPVVAAVSLVTVVMVTVAAVRRWNVPDDERFHVSIRAWFGAGYSDLRETETRTDVVLNAALAVSIVLAVGAAGFAIAAPPTGDQFSAIYILTETDDELAAEGYPTQLTAGESADLVVGVDNHEHERTEYAVVLLEQQVTFGNESDGGAGDVGEQERSDPVVIDQRELDRFRTTLAHNESWRHSHTVTPTVTGETVRLVWLLFPGGDVPAEPSVADTEYSVDRWVAVEPAERDSDGGV